MNSLEMARSYMVEAERRIKVAREALKEGSYAYAIRQCQEAVELLLKAALRLVGIEPPKWHDVGPVLIEYSNRFPQWFKDAIPELAAISRWLRREREPSMYGDEELGLPPTRLYTEPYARKAVEGAALVHQLVTKLLEEAQKAG
ncbi:MAG: HEPN domain-containing protein [Desulfurococcaceae archaeon]